MKGATLRRFYRVEGRMRGRIHYPFNWKFYVAVLALIVLMFMQLKLKTEATYKLQPRTADPAVEPAVMRCTCYTADEGAVCYSGCAPRYGIIAGKKEWVGMTACLYTYEIIDGKPVPREFLGFFEVKDTGAGIDTDGDGVGDSIINGQSIDVFQPTLEDAKQWVAAYGDYIMVYLVDGKG